MPVVGFLTLALLSLFWDHGPLVQTVAEVLEAFCVGSPSSDPPSRDDLPATASSQRAAFEGHVGAALAVALDLGYVQLGPVGQRPDSEVAIKNLGGSPAGQNLASSAPWLPLLSTVGRFMVSAMLRSSGVTALRSFLLGVEVEETALQFSQIRANVVARLLEGFLCLFDRPGQDGQQAKPNAPHIPIKYQGFVLLLHEYSVIGGTLEDAKLMSLFDLPAIGEVVAPATIRWAQMETERLEAMSRTLRSSSELMEMTGVRGVNRLEEFWPRDLDMLSFCAGPVDELSRLRAIERATAPGNWFETVTQHRTLMWSAWRQETVMGAGVRMAKLAAVWGGDDMEAIGRELKNCEAVFADDVVKASFSAMGVEAPLQQYQIVFALWRTVTEQLEALQTALGRKDFGLAAQVIHVFEDRAQLTLSQGTDNPRSRYLIGVLASMRESRGTKLYEAKAEALKAAHVRPDFQQMEALCDELVSEWDEGALPSISESIIIFIRTTRVRALMSTAIQQHKWQRGIGLSDDMDRLRARAAALGQEPPPSSAAGGGGSRRWDEEQLRGLRDCAVDNRELDAGSRPGVVGARVPLAMREVARWLELLH
ncbi:hypothetical protein GGTG_05874 [Gaeumannomyces tritici R3-111a-1]|uniref:Uncharacterized protein n=1 Tax=Gaeumannomyces tritici (strain R3-111a-1) TaxID=644352 RepID=J3NX67_GAET3|nr:hypothetical protein GGTG_05874 [Gaeumannomyces tritici R3-111a-1]EJT75949.1 hypothetical protein GGTG_05874 [Gaeumannomyces tritici R3-111a-1]